MGPTSVVEKAEITDSDLLSKPKAFNFAFSQPWGMQSKALNRSVKTAAKTPLLSLFFHFYNDH